MPAWLPVRWASILRRVQVSRKQRTSDGTLTVARVRFEIPSAYRSLLKPTERVARWDLSSIGLVDPRRDTHLATLLPLDKERNADRRRRAISDAAGVSASASIGAPTGTAPLLRQYMAEYAATGLPPAYVPHDTSVDHDTDDEEPDE